jgi:hypothetical protein
MTEHKEDVPATDETECCRSAGYLEPKMEDLLSPEKVSSTEMPLASDLEGEYVTFCLGANVPKTFEIEINTDKSRMRKRFLQLNKRLRANL